MNEKNLIPMNERSENEARELGRKGGIASGESRRKMAFLRKMMEEGLKMKTVVNDKETSWAAAITNNILNIAADYMRPHAAVNAYKVILQMLGQDRPEEQGNDEAIAILEQILETQRAIAFAEANKDND